MMLISFRQVQRCLQGCVLSMINSTSKLTLSSSTAPAVFRSVTTSTSSSQININTEPTIQYPTINSDTPYHYEFNTSSKETLPPPSNSTNDSFSTISPEEIRKFSSMSQEWWNENGKFKMLHQMNPIRMSYIRDIIENWRQQQEQHHHNSTISDHENRSIPYLPFKNLSILDIGCGGGLLSESLARLGGNVLGADASPENIAIATIHAENNPRLTASGGSLTYRTATAEQLVDEGQTFDIICGLEVIEHVKDPQAFLSILCSMLKPDSLLFISTLNRTVPSYLLSILLAEHVLGLVPKGTHHFNKYLLPQEIREWASQENLFEIELKGMGWDPLRGWWLTDMVGGPIINYMWVGQKLKSIESNEEFSSEEHALNDENNKKMDPSITINL